MKLVVANWKLNPSTEREAVELAKKEDLDGIVLMPPLPFLAPVGEVLKKAELGSQDVFYEEEGAYTGEVSPEQLKSLGVKYVLVGHSERRALGETDEIINKKVLAALKEELKVVLCVGEKERQRTEDKGQRTKNRGLRREKEFVRQQLRSALSLVLSPKSSVIVAYEPVWAISTRSHGRSDTPEDAAEMIGFIKVVFTELLGGPSTRSARSGHKAPLVLYGGSVNVHDVEGFLKQKEIDGVLVGAASLDAEEFGKIVKIARNF